jgi:hypothetical protein
MVMMRCNRLRVARIYRKIFTAALVSPGQVSAFTSVSVGTGIAEEMPMKIDVNSRLDLQHWAARLGVSRTRLIATIAAVGPDPRDVEARISRERHHDQDEHLRLVDRRKLAFHAFD